MRQGTIIAIKSSATSNNLIGVVIKGTEQFNGKVIKITMEQLKQILKTMPDAVDNCVLRNGEVEFTNGTHKRYTDLNSSAIRPLVVLNKIEVDNKIIYELCDYTGETLLADEERAAVYLNTHGIANGKIFERGTTTVISPISGEYPSRKLSDEELENLSYNLNTINEFRETQELRKNQAERVKKQTEEELRRSEARSKQEALDKLAMHLEESTSGLLDGLLEKAAKLGMKFELMTESEILAYQTSMRDVLQYNNVAFREENIECNVTIADKNNIIPVRYTVFNISDGKMEYDAYNSAIGVRMVMTNGKIASTSVIRMCVLANKETHKIISDKKGILVGSAGDIKADKLNSELAKGSRIYTKGLLNMQDISENVDELLKAKTFGAKLASTGNILKSMLDLGK